MPFQTQWYIPNQILFTRYWGEQTADEFAGSIKALYSKVDGSDRFIVHSIADVSDLTKPISFVEAMRVIAKTRGHSRAGWILSYGERDSLMRFVASASIQILHLRFRIFNTFQECCDFLKEVDPDLDWERADPLVLRVENEPENES